MTTPRDIWNLCREVAESVWTDRPSMGYIETAAQLLFMTAAHESKSLRGEHFAERRQRFNGPEPSEYYGAHSLWQMECAGMKDGIKFVLSRPELLRRIDALLFEHGLSDFDTLTRDFDALLERLQKPEFDALACVLARVYYLQRPGAIPKTIAEQARYAKKYWNTDKGKATPEDYAGAVAELYFTEEK